MSNEPNVSLDKIHQRIMKNKREIIQNVKNAIDTAIRANKRLDDYKIVWQQLQTIASPEIEKILAREFSGADFITTKSKSTYPDLKMVYAGKKVAIDIKSNEAQKEPWYDIARLDSIYTERLDKYDEEYDLVVKYDSENGNLIDVYFELMRQTVGLNTNCSGVKFRPYDGKLRPKTWQEFASGKCYWNEIQEFKDGIRRSQIYRWKRLVLETLIPLLTDKEKKEFKDLFG